MTNQNSKPRFTRATHSIEVRPEDKLLVYSLAEKRAHPSLIDPYDVVGPGLYPDEEAKWEPNGSGVALTVWGRWIEDDGSSKLDFHNQDTEVAYSHGFTTLDLENHGLAALMREMLLLVLGEPADLEKDVHVDPEGTIPALPGAIDRSMLKFQPGQDKIKVLNVPDDIRFGGSIRHAIGHIKEVMQAKTPSQLLEA
jgi:hypothetical protein